MMAKPAYVWDGSAWQPFGSSGADGADGLGVPAGGTTGQVLAKASNADNDTEWVSQSVTSGGWFSVILQSIGGVNWSSVYHVLQDDDGNTYGVGEIGDNTEQQPALFKVDAHGDVVWSAMVGTTFDTNVDAFYWPSKLLGIYRNRLYLTMYGTDDSFTTEREVVVCLDASDGSIVWQKSFPTSPVHTLRGGILTSSGHLIFGISSEAPAYYYVVLDADGDFVFGQNLTFSSGTTLSAQFCEVDGVVYAYFRNTADVGHLYKMDFISQSATLVSTAASGVAAARTIGFSDDRYIYFTPPSDGTKVAVYDTVGSAWLGIYTLSGGTISRAGPGYGNGVGIAFTPSGQLYQFIFQLYPDGRTGPTWRLSFFSDLAMTTLLSTSVNEFALGSDQLVASFVHGNYDSGIAKLPVTFDVNVQENSHGTSMITWAYEGTHVSVSKAAVTAPASILTLGAYTGPALTSAPLASQPIPAGWVLQVTKF